MKPVLVAQLRVTPQRLHELSAGLAESRLVEALDEDTWSARDVLAHLRACADVWGAAVTRLLEEDRPTFRAVSPRTYVHETDYLAASFGSSLEAFAMQRAQLVIDLEALEPRQWELSGTVTGAGRPLHPTVLSYVERLVRHERSHVRQVERILT